MEAVIRDVLDTDLADRVVRDEAWTHLASRLAAHEVHGADVRVQLTAAVRVEDGGPDSTVESFAKIYHQRIGAPAGSQTETGLPSWVSPPPVGVDGDNRETRAWLHAQAELIHDRTQALVDTVTAKPEPWSEKLRPSPDDASLQRAWRRDLGNVVAFRDLNQITDTESPLGAARTDDDAYTAAAVSLERLRAVEDNVAAEARRRVAGLRQRLSADTDLGEGVDATDRVRRLRERHVEQDKPASNDDPIRRGRGHRPTV